MRDVKLDKQFSPTDEEARRCGIGGSEAYAAAGVMTDQMRKWATSQYELFCMKIGKLAPKDLSDNQSVLWGSWLETPVIEKINKTTKYRLRKDRSTHYSADYPFLYAHIDAYIVGKSIEAYGERYKNVIAEIKCPSTYSKDKYGEEGTNEIPIWQLMQCVHYLVVHPTVDAVFVFVQFPHDKLKLYVVKPDKKVLETYIKAASRFWAFVEEARKNPKMKGGPVPSTFQDLTIANWDHDNNYDKLELGAVIHYKQMKAAEAEEADAKSRKDKHRLDLIRSIGNKPGGFLDNGDLLKLQRRETRYYTPAMVEKKFPKEFASCTKFDKSKFTEKYSPLVDSICENRKSVQIKVSTPK